MAEQQRVASKLYNIVYYDTKIFWKWISAQAGQAFT